MTYLEGWLLWIAGIVITVILSVLLVFELTYKPEPHITKPVYAVSCVDGTLREKYSTGPWLETHDKHGETISCSTD